MRFANRFTFNSLMYVFGIIGLLFLVMPILIILPMAFTANNHLGFPVCNYSFKWILNIFNENRWYKPILNSLYIAFCTGLISTFLGIIGAYSIVHLRSRLKSLLIFILITPLFIPTIIIAVGLLILYSQMSLIDSYLGIILGHVILAFPYSFIILTISLNDNNLRLEEIAYSLGATKFYSFMRILVPEIKKSITISFFLSFLVSFDEPIISLFISNIHARTLPRQILDGIKYNSDPTIAAIASIMIIISFIFILGQSLKKASNE
jgi:ABC-type spermidine/putrescine transport system permease subunit II